jgi:hypothetical protein
VCTPAGLPISWALTHPSLDERQVLMAVLDHDSPCWRSGRAAAAARRQGLHLRRTRRVPARPRGELLRPAYRSRAPRSGQALLAPIRQLIESVYDPLDTLKGQLDLELHGGRTLAGVTARVAQRLLALTAAIWHNRATGQPVTRSLLAYDH